MKRLLGLENELSYVTDGRVNKYAMGFVIPVPSTVSALHFTWRSGSASSPTYMISASSSHPTALPTPTLNITKEGTVPAEPQVWRRFLPTFIQHFSSSIQLVPHSTNPPFNSSPILLVSHSTRPSFKWSPFNSSPPQVWRLSLQCSGAEAAEVICTLNIILDNHPHNFTTFCNL